MIMSLDILTRTYGGLVDATIVKITATS